MPKWFKNLKFFCGESSVSEKLPPRKYGTIKACPAIKDFIETGIEIPLWSDIDFFIDTNKKTVEWNYANVYSNFKTVDSHHPNQYDTLQEKYINVKVISPWIFKCSEPINWLLTRPTYQSSVFDDHGIVHCDGIVNYKNNFTTNTNLMFPLGKESYNVGFLAGEIFQKFIPITEKPINIEVKHCTEEYFNSMAQLNKSVSFSDSAFYRRLRKIWGYR